MDSCRVQIAERFFGFSLNRRQWVGMIILGLGMAVLAAIAATATAANVLGIVGGVVVFGDPLGHDAPTVIGRLTAFVLVLCALSLMPAPVRAQEALSEQAKAEAKRTRAKRGGPRRPSVEVSQV